MIKNILSVWKFFADSGTEKVLFVVFAFFIWINAVSAILYKPVFLVGDEVENIVTTARGIPESLFTHAAVTTGNSNGRFYPLGHYDLNILTFIPGAVTPRAHYVFIAFSFTAAFIVLAYFLVYYAKKRGMSFPFYRTAAVLFFFFFTPGVIVVYLKLVYPERILVFLFSVFFLFYIKALESGKLYWYIAAFIMAAVSCYVKEPVFGFFLVFAVANLYFCGKKTDKRQRVFYFSIIVNSLFYIAVYYLLVWRNRTAVYAGTGDTVFLKNLFMLFLNSAVIVYPLMLFVMESVGNIKKYIRGKIFTPDEIFPYTMLAAGMTYVMAVALLKLNAGYYLVPAVAASLPAAVVIKPHIPKAGYLCVLAVLFLWCVHEHGFVVNAMHKDRVTGARITDFINNSAVRGGSLYFVVPPHENTAENSHTLNFPDIYRKFTVFYTGRNIECRIVPEKDMPVNKPEINDIVVFAAMRGRDGIPVLPSARLENMLESRGFEYQLYYADQLFFIHGNNVRKSVSPGS